MATFFYLPSFTSPTRHQSGRFHAVKKIWFGSIATIWARLCTGFWWEFGSCRCCCRLLSCPLFEWKNSVDTRSEGQVCNSPSSPLIKKPFYSSSAKKLFFIPSSCRSAMFQKYYQRFFWQSSTSPHLLLSDKKG